VELLIGSRQLLERLPQADMLQLCNADKSMYELDLLPAFVLSGVALPADPRYNVFDWDTWHELDVLRRELAARFGERQP
jgi:hypothetical protein